MANTPYLKTYRLQKLGLGKLTAAQKRKVAAVCNCTTEYVEMAISTDYPCLAYNVWLAIAREIGNHQYIKMYGRK